MKSFNQLCVEFPLVSPRFYMYMQLRHALRAQGRTSTFQVEDSKIFTDIFSTSDKKGIISKINAFLLVYIQAPGFLPCRGKWEADVGPLDGATWEQILEAGPLGSPSAAHK